MKADELGKEMLAAAKKSLAKDWGKGEAYATPELKRLATCLVDIHALKSQGTVDEQQAKALLRIHRIATESVLLTIEGLGIIAVENAINAAFAAVKETVNKAIGFVLL